MGGRKMAAKLENRIRELESEMDSEQRRLGDATKNFRKADRMIKEYTYKEAEEIAALNLAKFRKTQQELQECLERADLSEQAVAKFRARGRSVSMAREF